MNRLTTSSPLAAPGRGGRRPVVSTGTVDARRLRVVERVATVECWLRWPHQSAHPAMLRRFARFRALDDTRLRALAARSLVYVAPAGTRLLERGARDAWNLFLLEGALRLTPDAGAPIALYGDSVPAPDPAIFGKPRRYTVDTLTPVSFLWLHDLLLVAVPGSNPGE